jgi:hypothetical protein
MAGQPSTGGAAELEQVCLTGAWLGAVAAQSGAPVSLSPGDIDEGLITVLTPVSTGSASEVLSSSFERADSYRTGLLEGLSGC